jgi:putative phage-type endonuclease
VTGLTKEQLELRRTAIGSSEIGTILGVSPYSPIELWRVKVEGYERPDSPDMERGRFLEPAVAAWYAHRMECALHDCGTMRHPSNPLVVATPDRIARAHHGKEQWTVELKTTSRSDDLWGEPGSDAVPMHYLSQVQWELLVTGHARGDLAVLKWGRTLDIYNIPADPELQRSLVQMGQEWWDKYVKTATPPPPDASEEYARYMAAKYPKVERPLVQATENAERIAAELREAAAQEKRFAEIAERARSTLKGYIADAEGLVGNGWVATWKPTKNGNRVFKLKAGERSA